MEGRRSKYKENNFFRGTFVSRDPSLFFTSYLRNDEEKWTVSWTVDHLIDKGGGKKIAKSTSCDVLTVSEGMCFVSFVGMSYATDKVMGSSEADREICIRSW